MSRVLPLLAVAAALAAAWHVKPLFEPVTPARLEAVGVREVRNENADRIDAVLAVRGPGLGLKLRNRVAEAIAEESARAGFDPLFVLAVMAVESDFQPQAVSPVGARGLMQVRPDTLIFLAQKEGLKLSAREMDRDPALQVRLAIRYLKQLQDRFGDVDVALMGYNAGPTKVAALLKTPGGLEPYRVYPRAVRSRHESLRHSHQFLFASRAIGLAGE